MMITAFVHDGPDEVQDRERRAALGRRRHLARDDPRVIAAAHADADAVPGAQGRARLGLVVAEQLEAVAPQDHGERELRLHVREVVAQTDPRPGAEREEGISTAPRLRLGPEARGVEGPWEL